MLDTQCTALWSNTDGARGNLNLGTTALIMTLGPMRTGTNHLWRGVV